MDSDSPRRPGRSEVALLLALALAALAVRLLRLLESPEPPGTDGYYYVVQVRRLLAEGRLHVPDASWTLRLLGLGAWLAREPILGVKAMSCALAAACVPVAWWTGGQLARACAPQGQELAGRERLAAWALACWAAASPTLMHLAGDFPKALGAAAPLLAVVGWGAAVSSGRLRARAWGLLAGLASVLLAATAHRLGAALLGVGVLGVALGLGLRGRASAPERKGPLVLLALAALLGFGALSAGLPNLLHPADLERVTSQWRLSLGVPPPFAYFALRSTHPVQQAELAAAWAGLPLGAVLLWRRRALRPLVAALWVPLAVCLFPLWRGDVLDVGYRTSLLAPLLAAPLAVLALPARVPRLLHSRLAAALALALVALSRWGFEPSVTPPYARFRAVLAALPEPLPELLIAHQGLNFLYGHLAWREAMAWAPEPGLERTRIGRIVWGVRPGEWEAFAPSDEALPRPVWLDLDYAYVREDVWEAFLARAREEGDDDLQERLADWRNPSVVRPASLLRNRRAHAGP